MPGTTSFPGALDTFPDIQPDTAEDAEGFEHDVVHNNIAAAVAAMQAKVGIDDSEDAESIDARLAALEASAAPTLHYRRTDLVATGGETVLSTVQDPYEGSLELYVDGVLIPLADYVVSNGHIVTLDSAAGAADLYSVRYLTEDAGTAAALWVAELTLTGTFADATVDEAYESDITISGGDGTYSLTGGTGVASGTLPDGLSLSIVEDSGSHYLRLSGTPTEAYDDSFTVSVDSGDGQTATSEQAVEIASTELWTPADLAVPPVVWVNDESAVTDDGSGACSQWSDLSGNDLHFSQSSPSTMPLIVAGELNGRRVLRFDGSNDYLYLTNDGLDIFRNTGAGWMLLVRRRAGVDATNTNRTVFSACTPTPGITRFAYRLGSSTAKNLPEFRGRRENGDSVKVLAAATTTDTDAHIDLVTMDWATGGCTIYLDGAEDSQDASLTSDGVTSDSASSNITLGCIVGSGPSQNVDADIAEVILGSGSLPDSSEIDKLCGYAAWRWGLTGNLPAEHPYKNAPPYV